MPAFHQPIEDDERRAAIANALYRAFDDLRAYVEGDGGGLSVAAGRVLAALKREMALDPHKPLLAFGKPYAEWRADAELIKSSSVAKPFMELERAVEMRPHPFTIPTDGYGDAHVRFTVRRPSRLGKGHLAGLVVTIDFVDRALVGSFPADQAPFKAPRERDQRVLDHIAGVERAIRGAPTVVTSVLALLSLGPSRRVRERVFARPEFAVDIVRVKPAASGLAAGVMIAALGVGSIFTAYRMMAEDQQLFFALGQSDGLYAVELTWDPHGRAPGEFLVTRAGPDGETTEPATSIPAHVSGLRAGRTYTFRVRRRLFGRVPWSYVTRSQVVEVAVGQGPFVMSPEPSFGCTDIRITPPEPRVGQEVEFRASLHGTTTIDDVRFVWSIGNLPAGREGNPVRYAFPRPATYVVSLTLSRPGGGSRSCGQQDVLVREVSHPPATPTPRPVASEVALSGAVQALEPLGGGLLLALHRDAVSVVDVGDRAGAPRVTASLTLPGARDAAVVGRQAYVALGVAGLAQVDLTDPGRPAVRGTVAGDFQHVAARGTTLVASGALPEVRLYALSPLGHPEPAQVVSIWSGIVTRLVFSDDGMVLCAREKDAKGIGSGLARLTIRDGSSSELLSPFDVSDVAATPDVAYIATQGYGLTVVSVAGDRPVTTLPPEEPGTNPAPRAASMSLVGDRLYVSSSDGSTQVFDVSVPTRPVVAGRLPVRQRSFRVIGVGDRLAVGAEGSLLVVSHP